MNFEAAYKLILFAPRSEDPTESAPLAQRDNPSEQFVVSTLPTGPGRPILSRPRGRRGRLDLVRRRADTGEMTVRVLDQVEGSDQLHRWVTAFLGDAAGRPRFLRLRAQFLESLDGGATWAPLLTGRVWKPALQTKLWWEFIVRDTMEDLDTEIFVGPPGGPTTTYAYPSPLLPSDGLVEKYGAFRTVPWLKGKVEAVAGSFNDLKKIVIDKMHDDAIRNARTEAFEELNFGPRRTVPSTRPGRVVNLARDGRLRLKVTRSTSAPGRVGSVGDFALTEIGSAERFGALDYRAAAFVTGARGVLQAGIFPLAEIEPRFMAVPEVGDDVEWFVYRYARPTKAAPLFIDEVHPITFLRHILAGHFGPLSDDGTPRISIPFDAARFAALEADHSIRRMRFVIDEAAVMRDFIEQQILLPNHLAYRVTPAGELTLIDLRLPSTLAGIQVISADDVAWNADGPLWEHDPAGTVTQVMVHHYFDWQPTEKLAPGPKRGEPPLAARPSRVEEIQGSVGEIFGSHGDLGERIVEIDARGFRETATGNLSALESPQWVKEAVDEIVTFYRGHFGAGLMGATLKGRRTASVSSCFEGDLRIVEVPHLPDPATSRRGGRRVMRCVERSPDGPHIQLRMVDLGPDLIALPPAMGALARSADDPRHTVTAALALNALAEPAVIYAAVTDQNVVERPAEHDERWRLAGRLDFSGSLAIGQVPSGSRVWIRARTLTALLGMTPKLPSSWVYPAAGFIDTEALPAPSALMVAEITRTTAALSWQLGDTRSEVQVLLVAGAPPSLWTDAHVAARLPDGSTRYTLRGMSGPGDQFTLAVRCRDAFGGVSAVARATIVTTDILPKAPRPAAIALAVAGGA